MSAPLGPIRRTVLAIPAQSFDPKAPPETSFFWFNFFSALASGETVLSAVVVATVVTGVDPSPSALIDGSASVESDGYNVKQLITGGLNGVTYLLTCTATTSLGNHPVLTGTLAVANA